MGDPGGPSSPKGSACSGICSRGGREPARDRRPPLPRRSAGDPEPVEPGLADGGVPAQPPAAAGGAGAAGESPASWARSTAACRTADGAGPAPAPTPAAAGAPAVAVSHGWGSG
jgi:hypothetical protein